MSKSVDSAALALPPPVRVDLGERGYDIRFYSGSPGTIAGDIKAFCPEKAFVVTNETIWALHGEQFAAALTAAGISFITVKVGDGEKFKCLESASQLYDEMIRNQFGRRGCVIAFGGGVIGDLAGYVAATFMRGVNFVQVPTTVVAMVDSSVGGKTGVDHPLGKNLIGAFHQPKVVAVDIEYLNTLDRHNIEGGFAEVIKYGVILDADFFTFLEGNIGAAMELKAEPLLHCVRRSCEIKAQIVTQDEFEGGVRAYLNYGHTFGHAIESLSEYKEKQFHGQAVAIGMTAAAELSCDLGLFSREDAQRQETLLRRTGLPTRIPAGIAPEQIVERMKSDKKVLSGKVRFILPREIGKVDLRDDVPKETVLKVLNRLKS